MRRIVPLLLLPALPLLVACSADAGDTSATASWEAAGLGLTELECAELQTDWAEGAATRPERCWTFEETDGLPGTFAAISADFTEAIGSEPTFGPACAAAEEGDRSLGCQARWTVGDTTVLLTSGITLEWLGAAVEDGSDVDILDPSLAATHELTLWTGGAELAEGQGEAELYYSVPAS